MGLLSIKHILCLAFIISLCGHGCSMLGCHPEGPGSNPAIDTYIEVFLYNKEIASRSRLVHFMAKWH